MNTPPFGVSLSLEREALYLALRADIEARLRGVCSEWNDSEFQGLVDRIAETSHKYAMRTRRQKLDRV
jgi:hypothetical protein